MYFGQRFFLQIFVAIGHFWAIWPLVDPRWPLLDRWPQQYITLWPEVLSTKSGGHRAFLSNLASGWLLLTPAWPSTPAMHYTLVRGSFNQIWLPYGISKADWPPDDLWPLMGLLRKYALKPCGSIPYPHAKFQLDTLKHDKTHSTHTPTPPPTHRLSNILII